MGSALQQRMHDAGQDTDLTHNEGSNQDPAVQTPSRVTVAARTMDNSTLSYPQSQRPAADCQVWTNQGSISGYINDVQDLLQANEDVDRTELTEDGMNMDVLTRRR